MANASKDPGSELLDARYTAFYVFTRLKLDHHILVILRE
jgi:hypothetical protein